MSSSPKNYRSPVERVQDLPRILQALRQAAGQAMERHRQAGVPVAVWRNEQVEWIEPGDIPLGEDPPKTTGG